MDNCKDLLSEFRCCIVVPTYNNGASLAKVINDVKGMAPTIVVNDGSTDDTEDVLKCCPEVDVITIGKNCGKGNALRKGFQHALSRGFDYAITLDSDGQHLAEDIPVFAGRLLEKPGSLIIGARNMDIDNVPAKSGVGKRISNFWIKVCTGMDLPDTQSGFRLYPIRKMDGIKYISTRFEFEVEVIVKSAWKGINIESVPIQVFYPPEKERISHYRPFIDFVRISMLNVLLVTRALLVFWPGKVFKKYRKKKLRQILKEELLQATESNVKLAFSIGFGIFMGIVPIWGYQLLVGFTLAHFLKLNKAIFFVAANISIPPMIPLILFVSFYTGGLILGEGGVMDISIMDMTFELAFEYFKQYVLGAVVFAIVAGFASFGISYFSLSLFRKNKIR